jgi:hypothetical protein
MNMWALGSDDSTRSLLNFQRLRAISLLFAVGAIALEAMAVDPQTNSLAESASVLSSPKPSHSYTDLADLTEAPSVSSMAGASFVTATDVDRDADRVSNLPSIQVPRKPLPDPNSAVYYKNKLDVSVEGGWLPINVPFMFDFLVGDAYIVEAVHYTMVPVFASVDWQISHIDGPLFLRGTWDAAFGATAAAIPRGPESKFFGYHMGIRRNFVQRRWKVVPYLDGRVGIGHIDARGPEGVWGSQGQDLTFSLNISSGVRYQLSKRYSVSGGVGYMHISNMYLSLPRYANNGINVVGMMLGVHYRIPTREERTRAQ